MLVVRAVLGAFEGGAMPGIAFFLSFFVQEERVIFPHEYIYRIKLAGYFFGWTSCRRTVVS
jgi:hypothetical protein